MSQHEPMFHMDESYNWRWYIVDSYGHFIAMSVLSFFRYEDAKRDYEMAWLIMRQAA